MIQEPIDWAWNGRALVSVILMFAAMLVVVRIGRAIERWIQRRIQRTNRKHFRTSVIPNQAYEYDEPDVSDSEFFRGPPDDDPRSAA